jgi:hypothetical protein
MTTRREIICLAPVLFLLSFGSGTGCSLLYAPDFESLQSRDDRDGGLIDGGPAGEGGTKRGCAALAPTPKFCRDFDDDKPIADGWDAFAQKAGTVSFDPFAFSPPRSARVTLNGASGCLVTEMTKTFATPGAQRVAIHTRFRPSWSGQHAPLFVRFRSAAGSDGCGMFLYLAFNAAGGNAAINVQSGSPAADDVRAVSGFPRLNEWTDIGITATSGAGGPAMRVAFEHEDGTVSEKTELLDNCVLGGAVDLSLGFHCDSGEGEARYDDIRVDWQ